MTRLPRASRALPARLFAFLACGAIAALALAAGGCAGPGGAEAPAGAPAVPPRDTTGAAPTSILAQRLAPAEIENWQAIHPDALLLDVREPAEWDDDLGHLEGAMLIPVGELDGRLMELESYRERPVLVYCRSGVRSAEAAEILLRAGFRDVSSLTGGLAAYRRLHPR